MRKTVLSAVIFSVLSGLSFAQLVQDKGQVIAPQAHMSRDIPAMNFPAPDLEQLRIEDEQRDKNGEYYRIGVAMFTNIT